MMYCVFYQYLAYGDSKIVFMGVYNSRTAAKLAINNDSDERNYREQENYIIKEVKINEECSFVLYDYWGDVS